MLKEGSAEHQISKKAGTFNLEKLEIKAQHSFLEYVFGGCEIDLSMAIDFTLSNGDPKDPSSLHYFDPRKNQYMQAIRSVGDILQFYNSDKMVNLYGFGGAIAPFNNRGSHCFALNGDIFNPRVNGIESVISHYKTALNACNLYGPTHFSKVLAETNDYA